LSIGVNGTSIIQYINGPKLSVIQDYIVSFFDNGNHHGFSSLCFFSQYLHEFESFGKFDQLICCFFGCLTSGSEFFQFKNLFVLSSSIALIFSQMSFEMIQLIF
jgi:hypothetical protein